MPLLKQVLTPVVTGFLLLGIGGCNKSTEESGPSEPSTSVAELAKPLVDVDGKKDDWSEEHHVFGGFADYRLYMRNDDSSLYLFHQLASNDIERLYKEPVPRVTQLYFDIDNDGATGSGSAFMTMSLFGGGAPAPSDHPESSTGFEYRLVVGSDLKSEAEKTLSVYCSLANVADITPVQEDVEPTGMWHTEDVKTDSDGRIAVSADAIEIMVPLQLQADSTVRVLLIQDVEGILNKHTYFFTYSAT